MAELKQLNCNKSYGGEQKRYEHASDVCACNMKFSIYVPGGSSALLPVVYYLSGLTCTDLNCVEKSGIQRYASELQMIVVFPDTSPRGLGYPGEAESWDFGVGAGMYIDATESPWNVGFKMFSYVTQELPMIIEKNFPVDSKRQSIMGHSMGGHGALISSLNNPGRFRSVSCFAPITNPSVVPWGIKAFGKYLGEDKESWKKYDGVELVRAYTGPNLPILVDQGSSDQFLEVQLKPQNLKSAVEGNKNIELTLNIHDGYDHSYYFISSFIESHMKFHYNHSK